MEKSDGVASTTNALSKIVNLAVMQLVKEQGFHKADKYCLEVLTEMLECLMVECGRSSARAAELAGRTVPVVGDVIISLINMGLPLHGIDTFAKRPHRPIIPMPAVMPAQKPLNLLQAGTKASPPPHIPNYLPPLPDPHAYVRTPTYRQPVTEYEAIREKFANQKRDIEKALTKFLTKTSETHSLFDADSENMFPLIACKPSYPPYLEALNPTDQAFDFEELEYHFLVATRTEDITSKDDKDDESGEEEENERAEKESKQSNAHNDIKPNSNTNKAILENPNIDNPYLRAASLPPKRLKYAQYSNISKTLTKVTDLHF